MSSIVGDSARTCGRIAAKQSITPPRHTYENDDTTRQRWGTEGKEGKWGRATGEIQVFGSQAKNACSGPGRSFWSTALATGRSRLMSHCAIRKKNKGEKINTGPAQTIVSHLRLLQLPIGRAWRVGGSRACPEHASWARGPSKSIFRRTGIAVGAHPVAALTSTSMEIRDQSPVSRNVSTAPLLL